MQMGGVSDRNWHLAMLEGARAKILHLGGRSTAYAYLLLQLIKGLCRRFLEKLRLNFFIQLYHINFSKIKKQKKVNEDEIN